MAREFNSTNREDMLILTRMLLGRTNATIGRPVMEGTEWHVFEDMGHWWSMPPGGGEEDVKMHDTLPQALRQAGMTREAEILEWCSTYVAACLQDNSVDGTPRGYTRSWPPSMSEFRSAVIKATPVKGSYRAQEIRVHRSEHEAVLNHWSKTNKAKGRIPYVDKHRPFPYVRITDTGSYGPGGIEVILDDGKGKVVKVLVLQKPSPVKKTSKKKVEKKA